MTRTHPPFPRAFGVLATACALFALAWFAPSAQADNPPTPEQVREAEAQRDALKAQIISIDAEIAGIEARLGSKLTEVEAQEGALEEVKAELLETRKRIEETRARYDRIVRRLSDRAAEAYIQGPGSSVEFLLGASSLADLSDRLEYVDAVARSDADLANDVENLRVVLEADEARLADLEEQRSKQLAETRAEAASITADLNRHAELRDQRKAAFASAREFAKQLGEERQAYLEELRRELRQQQQQQQGGAHAPVTLPPEWRGVLEVCPVAPPRYFGDGFGAPRYAGGFHLHKGVDILAATGTAIYAPFDGTAQTGYNSLGGYTVSVSGSRGTVYNAHLSKYSDHSNGPVHRGDVIGYVGDTGDAIGTPHDHFEFHPNAMPSGWVVSAYGYAIIEDAINPYPLLVDACG
jgi:murein DD-endopeptidase MepM/ murein hydrolase activator NlpD